MDQIVERSASTADSMDKLAHTVSVASGEIGQLTGWVNQASQDLLDERGKLLVLIGGLQAKGVVLSDLVA